MAGRGRAMDNIFIERFWRSLKYEDIYLKERADVPGLFTGVSRNYIPDDQGKLRMAVTVQIGYINGLRNKRIFQRSLLIRSFPNPLM